MSSFASCNGLPVVAGTLVIPLVGAWTADIHLATQQSVSGQATVVIGNLTLHGFIYRSDSYGGQVRARLVGGNGGWRQPVASQGYGTSAGVKLSTVLQDAASAAGEQIQVATDQNIGNAYVRANFSTSVAGDILWQMLSQGFIAAWYVAPNGTTQTAPWPSVSVATPFTVTDQKPDEGMVEVATEDYVSWLPGCTFSSPLLQGGQTFTNGGVHYAWSNDGKFRFQVLTGTQDRFLGPLQQVIQKELQPTRFYGRYSYTISNPSVTTVDASPVDPSGGLPDLQNVPLSADSIASITPPDGGQCHIMFLDGVPTKPLCVWCEADDSNGPSTVTLAPNQINTPPIARVDDTVVVAFPPLMQVAGTLSGAPFVGVLTIVTPGLGVIQTGSSVVSSG